MGKQTAGILGAFTGKVGNIVGSKWKNTDTIRKLVKPSNPNTAGQQSQRGKFLICQKTASALLETVVKPYWNQLVSSESGYNTFISRNTKRVSNNTDFSNLLTGSGSYEPLSSFISAVYTTGTGNLVFSWNPDVITVGQNTDRVIAVVIDATNWDPATGQQILLPYVSATETRVDETVTIDVGVGKLVANLHCYLFAITPAGEVLKVSNSLYKLAETP